MTRPDSGESGRVAIGAWRRAVRQADVCAACGALRRCRQSCCRRSDGRQHWQWIAQTVTSVSAGGTRLAGRVDSNIFHRWSSISDDGVNSGTIFRS